MFTRTRDPISSGHAYLVSGQALAGRDVAAARTRFAKARELFDANGAVLFARLTEREERRMNARQPRRSRSGAAPEVNSLTERELEVAHLVAAGLTNRQIAEKLVLSARTVETHVTKVLAKLDIATRSAVAYALSRRPDS